MTRVFLICSGLGNIRRGFESFSEECYAELSSDPRLDLYLFGGGGASVGRRRQLFSIGRQSRLASLFARVLGRPEYWIEQVSFGLALLPYLFFLRPDVVVFSDGTLGNFLWHVRKRSKAGFKLLLSNGAPFQPPFERWDHIHQVAPAHYEAAISSGEAPARHTLLPYAITVPETLTVLSQDERSELREKLSLPSDRRIILSPGSRNRCHKRMDYLITELSRMPEPRPFLLMLGEWHKESDEIERLATDLLGSENFRSLTTQASEMPLYYLCADCVVLASLTEGLARALLEATANGVPCLVHDYPVTRFVLGEEGYYRDFTKPGGIVDALEQVRSPLEDPERADARFQRANTYFSWQVLRERYIELFLSTALSSERVSEHAGC